uniref:Phosphopantetheine attachment site n=1 Tax=Candidatus Kentrum sp. LPFa TaxID=2126335 RepID=A0A450XU81_9GAMM|nr:MAG: Phosphopantetheine attachment site [Candidatus Kentron sp. LPFa]VFK32833.1 MAG: Phosphopantetheine attachment site [Candidatus Kentron sp. LPFa]
MTELLRNEAIPRSVRTVNLAGEALKRSLAQGLYALPHMEAVYNLYGPSEDTTYSTWSLVARDSADPPCIGRPLGNTRAYILDARLQPLPPGLSGELCLAGMGLAQGYLRRPDLTAERFVEIELFGRLERIYRTGDLARWLPDGQLQYLGRMDHQIKLRGYRIELGEIEAALTDHAGVDDAVVLLDETTDNPRLIAYVGSLCSSARKEALLARLRARLPDYMIPSLRVLPALPLNPNGKIDRARLPKPVIERGEFAPPRDISEQRVAEAWREVLDLTRIGIDENFSDLGGHSLLLTRVHFLLRRDYPGLHFVDLFGYPTARRLAAHLRALCADGAPAHTTAATQTIAAQAQTRTAERRAHRARLLQHRAK